MKKAILFCALSLSLVAWAGSVVHTAGEAETSAASTLAAMKEYFHATMPALTGDAFVDGALNFNQGAREYNTFWEDRFKDDFDQPDEYKKAFDDGKKMWDTPFSDGKKFADCFPNGGNGSAAFYPQVDKSGAVVTFEGALNQCLQTHHEKPLAYRDMKSMGALSLYARRFSDGARIAIKVETPSEQAAFARGKLLYYSRHGQLDMACASCHTQQAGRTLRSEELSPIIGQSTHFPVFRPNKANAHLDVVTLQMRYEGCQNNVKVAEPYKSGSPQLNDLEFFTTFMSNGLPLRSGAFRK